MVWICSTMTVFCTRLVLSHPPMTMSRASEISTSNESDISFWQTKRNSRDYIWISSKFQFQIKHFESTSGSSSRSKLADDDLLPQTDVNQFQNKFTISSPNWVWIGIDNRLISCLYYNAILWWWWLRGLSRLQHRHRKVKFISTIGSFNINYLLLRDPIERNKQNVLWSVALHPKVLSIFAAATTTRYGPANEDHQKIYS